MVRDHHEAEDICQDAFLKAFASLDTFSSEYRFSTWLFTIGYRVCLNRLRRKRPFSGDLDFSAMASEDGASPSATLESEEAGRVRASVWSAVDRLSPPQRATILLFYRNDFGCQEIARVLQLPLATVKSHLHRARARLRELLEALPDQDWSNFRNLSERAG
jgi:RNA polymerase sigma-70 factor (ECF subfamily)